MVIAIHQPNFLPWVGYFNKIKNSEKFVFLDDVQFERGKTFTSRTKILTNTGELWLTVPVKNKSEMVLIKDAEVDTNFFWKKKHLRTIEINYRKYPFFEEIYQIIQEVYRCNSQRLIDFNIPLIENICKYLGINATFIKSSELNISKEIKGWDKLLAIILELKGDIYLSGTGEGSKRYVNEEDLRLNNVKLEWQNLDFLQGENAELSELKSFSIILSLLKFGKNVCRFI